VLLEGDVITYARPAAAAPTAPAADVEVAAAMPGLWECHGHFAGLVVPDLERDVIEHAATKAARATADRRPPSTPG